jgi:hypothetical protein
MSLSDLAAIGNFVSGIAVLVSLIFIGIQIRQNTRAVRAQILQNFMDGWLGIGAMCSGHARVFVAGAGASAATFAAMPDDEKMTFMTAIFVIFKHYENMYLQHEKGVIEDQDWEAWTNHMFMYWHMPGVKLWWQSRAVCFSPAFRSFIESSRAPGIPPPSDLFTGTEGAAHVPG